MFSSRKTETFSFLKRVAHSGIAQRTIKTFRGHICTYRKPKKAIPTAVKTLGDRILIKRYEKGFYKANW